MPFEDWLFAAAALFWCSVTLVALRGARALVDLEPLAARAAETLSSVRAVVPVRDGADEIERTVQGLLDQRDVAVEVVAVDDRSSDATPAILARLAAADPRLTVRRVDALPDGWIGKCHACWIGAQDATTDWLLLVDADSHMAPDVVSRAIAAGEAAAVAHVCLIPQLREQTVGGRAVSLAMCLGLVAQSAGLENARSYMGVGAFNLVRRDAYLAIDGHRALRMEVVEDVGLAWLLRRGGFGTRLRMACRDFDVAWITSIGSVFRILEKNGFAIFRFRTASFLAVWSIGAAAWVAGLVGPWFGAAGLAATLGLASTAAAALACARRYRWHPVLALATPVALGVVQAAMAWSFWRTWSRDGVRWRDTRYPLFELRRGVVRGRNG